MLDHRQVGEQLVGQLLHGHPRPNGENGRLYQLARLWRHSLHADQSDGLRVWGEPLSMFGVRLVLPRLHRRRAVQVVLPAASVLIAATDQGIERIRTW